MLNPPMKYSQDGTNLTKLFEQCRLVAYPDSGGVWTIGWGHTRGVKKGDTCTQEQADAWLQQDLKFAIDNVNAVVDVSLTQGEFDSLCDFSFNCGTKALDSSTLLRLLNAGDFKDAAEQFQKWDHVGGVVVAGLLRRRLAEEKEFETTGESNA
jgi:lysozyme